MLTRSTFEMIKHKHGSYASWAVWGSIGVTPKSGMGDLSVFESDDLLPILKPNVVMLSLNLSKAINTTTHGSLTDGTSPASGKIDKTSFAWHVGGGVAYNLTEHIILDVTYRFAELGEAVWQAGSVQLTANHLHSNEFLFGARYQF